MEKIKELIKNLQEISGDNTIPKNVRDKLSNIISYLNGKDDTPIKIDKALHDLENICEDSNLQSYTRTQVWNIISMLETIK